MAKVSAKSKVKRVATPYDVAEHLRTPEEMAGYLDAWLEEAPEDATGIARALGDIARAKGRPRLRKTQDGVVRACTEPLALGEILASLPCLKWHVRLE